MLEKRTEGKSVIERRLRRAIQTSRDIIRTELMDMLVENMPAVMLFV